MAVVKVRVIDARCGLPVGYERTYKEGKDLDYMLDNGYWEIVADKKPKTEKKGRR